MFGFKCLNWFNGVSIIDLIYLIWHLLKIPIFIGREHWAVLQEHPVLPGLQAHVAEWPAASAGSPSGPHQSSVLLPQGQPDATSDALPQECPEPEQQGTNVSSKVITFAEPVMDHLLFIGLVPVKTRSSV